MISFHSLKGANQNQMNSLYIKHATTGILNSEQYQAFPQAKKRLEIYTCSRKGFVGQELIFLSLRNCVATDRDCNLKKVSSSIGKLDSIFRSKCLFCISLFVLCTFSFGHCFVCSSSIYRF